MNARRDFLAAAGTGLLAAALPARSQPAPLRVGWLSHPGAIHAQPFLDALRQGLRELGYTEGRNVVIDARWADNSARRGETLAADLVGLGPNVIVSLGPVTYAARRATTTIPIVFGFSGDPVKAGFAKSFSRPGGNLTGMSFMALELAAKRIELLKAMMPLAKNVAVVASSQHPGDDVERQVSERAAAEIGLQLQFFEMKTDVPLDQVLGAIEQSGCDAAVMFPIARIISESPRIAAWSVKNRIPAVSGWAQFADEGNLMSYGANLRESFRRLATYVDRIFKGARPSELPVELPLHVELVLNLRAARALGVTVPQSVMARADRLIE